MFTAIFEEKFEYSSKRPWLLAGMRPAPGAGTGPQSQLTPNYCPSIDTGRGKNWDNAFCRKTGKCNEGFVRVFTNQNTR